MMNLRIANYELRMPAEDDLAGRGENSSFTIGHSRCRRAFTLIELMVVVGIIGLILAVGAPTLFKLFHKEGFRKSVSDVLDTCNAARAQAIMGQRMTEVVFHPQQRSCEVAGGASGGWGGWASSAQFGEDVAIEMLDVNLTEYKDAEEARVRFYPDGRCDEMTLILRSDMNNLCGISLEISTGLATYLNEAEVEKLKNGRL